jgi:hypothetical protein
VLEAAVMKDATTRRSRGFGFVVFAHPTAVEQALAVKDLRVDGRKVGSGGALLTSGGLLLLLFCRVWRL